MLAVSLLLLTIVASLGQSATVATQLLRVGAFNVRTFGVSKMKKTEVVEVLAKVVLRYDIMLLQEIRDASGDSVKKLLAEVQKLNENYAFVISERLGRSKSYKEQYAYFYRTDRVNIEETFQFDDGPEDGTDVFEREPFCVLIESLLQVDNKFAVCGIHIKPSDVNNELNGMVKVHDDVTVRLATPNVMFMGDFNADCSYLSASELAASPMYSSKFNWLIGSEADTTTSCGTKCAYDRIVISGDFLTEAVVPKSARTYLFDREYDLTAEEAFAVSDHYPVEVSLMFP